MAWGTPGKKDWEKEVECDPCRLVRQVKEFDG
jgi:hypothetical protein